MDGTDAYHPSAIPTVGHVGTRVIPIDPSRSPYVGLVVKQVHNAGAQSLVIIMVCGLFVGGVLGLVPVDIGVAGVSERITVFVEQP